MVEILEAVSTIGNNKREVYGNLYKQLKRVDIGGHVKTLVFPGYVRFAVRRFADGGQWDAQYEDNQNSSNGHLI